MKRVVMIIVVVTFIVILAAFIYFVSGVSAISSPIKKYEYEGTVNELVINVRKFTLVDSNVRVNITDTTGGTDNIAIYMIITIKNNSNDVEYGWNCEEKKNNGKFKTVVSLTEAYDKTNNTGGYIRDAIGVDLLVDSFEKGFLSSLNQQEKIKIKPL